MESNIWRTARAADASSVVPDGLAPVAGIFWCTPQVSECHRRIEQSYCSRVGPVSEDCLARESGEQLRSHTHAGQNRDVNLGMAKEPEQMLPEQRRSALDRKSPVADQQAARHEEAGSGGAVENQQNSGGQQHGESQQGQDSRYKPGP